MRSEFMRALIVAAMLGAQAARAHDILATVKDDAGALLADAVVVAVPEAPFKVAPPKVETIVQEDKEFKPYVKAVVVGTPISFPNRDDVLHHVYSFSPARTFELKAYAGTPAAPIVFDKPGAIALGCNIHDWMLGYVYVSESPFFGKTGTDGTVHLAGLPAGNYRVRVWHPRLSVTEGETTQSLALTAGTAEVAWSLELKRDARIRRAPTRPGGGYR